ncbi:MAG: hypothetical protein HY223_03100 [Thaumarchaeota archaeon]|nr:hypothetical protein [Nitrososphaerota archaeon]
MVKNEVAIPPTAPKVEITANPIEPQLQAPALAPIMEPKIPRVIFLALFLNMRIRKTLALTTIPESAEITIINKNPSKLLWVTCITSIGSKNRYSETMDRPIKSATNIAPASKT